MLVSLYKPTIAWFSTINDLRNLRPLNFLNDIRSKRHAVPILAIDDEGFDPLVQLQGTPSA